MQRILSSTETGDVVAASLGSLIRTLGQLWRILFRHLPACAVHVCSHLLFTGAGGGRPRLQALTVSQIEARVEDPTITLKKLLKENK